MTYTETMETLHIDAKCSPDKVFEDGSCITLELLIEMAKAYNEDNPNAPIKMLKTLETLNPKKYKTYLVNEFSKRLEKVCDTQQCWVKQSFNNRLNRAIKEELQKYTYRPSGPKGRFTWLNTTHINETMNQYERKYPEFKFLGAVAIDFDDVSFYGIKDLDLNDMVKTQNKTKLGIVFNLDRHDQPGSHWCSMFANFKSGDILFYDSYAMAPRHQIRKLMRRFAKFMESDNIKPNADYNQIRHQYKNSECGVYSINFIHRLLDGDSFEQICQDKTTDSEINRMRDVYFT